MNRCGDLYTKYRTVNTVYIEYKSVVTHCHGLTHISLLQHTIIIIIIIIVQ